MRTQYDAKRHRTWCDDNDMMLKERRIWWWWYVKEHRVSMTKIYQDMTMISHLLPTSKMLTKIHKIVTKWGGPPCTNTNSSLPTPSPHPVQEFFRTKVKQMASASDDESCQPADGATTCNLLCSRYPLCEDIWYHSVFDSLSLGMLSRTRCAT